MSTQQASISPTALNSIQDMPKPTLPHTKMKDRFWVKSVKWHLYKRFLGSKGWKARYLFDGFVRELSPGDLAIDCGANVGHFTRIMASQGATVHAFEPDPHAFSRLQSNTSEFSNVILHNAAVGTHNTTTNLYRRGSFNQKPDRASISSSLFESKSNVDPNNSVEIEQIDFVSFLESLDQDVSILKMDIEGSEVALLEKLLEQDALDKCKRVFVETHEDRIPELAERTLKLKKSANSNKYKDKLFLDWH